MKNPNPNPNPTKHKKKQKKQQQQLISKQNQTKTPSKAQPKVTLKRKKPSKNFKYTKLTTLHTKETLENKNAR